jgi:alanine racemase
MLNTVSVRLNLDHLRHNYALAKGMAPAAQVFAVVKADGYGHGLLNIARGLASADGFAAIQLEDALALRCAGLAQPILILEGINDAREIAEVCEHHLIIVLHSHYQMAMLRAYQGQIPIKIWVKVNSSMNRFGFDPTEAIEVLRALEAKPNVKLEGLMMHFPSADDLDCDLDSQWTMFRSLVSTTQLPFSVANSAAMLRDPRTHGRLVRLGSALYGNNPFVGGKAFDALKGFRPVMRFAARIIDTACVAAGEPLGYGGTFIAEHAMRIGIVGCGYGDGYPASASTGAPVMLGGVRTRIVGSVAMNVMFIDLEPVPDAQIGDWVTLWGDAHLRIDEVAQHAGLGAEAIQCGLTKKHRVHLIEEDQLCGT